MKIICVGLNYPRHANEIGMTPSDAEPTIFLKPDTALLRNNDPFYIPDWAQRFDFETELVFRISRLGRHIEERFAHRYYDAVGLGIDFTARDLQDKLVKEGRPWEICKGFDYSAAISQMVPLADLPPVANLHFSLDINGERRQEATANQMIFPVDKIISYVSQFFSLRMGDLIFTGTPTGVGPVKEGDRLIGTLEGRTLLNFEIK